AAHRHGRVVAALAVESTGPGQDHEAAERALALEVRARRVEHGVPVVARVHDPDVAVRPELDLDGLRELARPASLPAHRPDVLAVRPEHAQLLCLALQHPDPAAWIHRERADPAEQVGPVAVRAPDAQLLDHPPFLAGPPQRGIGVLDHDVAGRQRVDGPGPPRGGAAVGRAAGGGEHGDGEGERRGGVLTHRRASSGARAGDAQLSILAPAPPAAVELLPRPRPRPRPGPYSGSNPLPPVRPSFSTHRCLSWPHSTMSTIARGSMSKLCRSGTDR